MNVTNTFTSIDSPAKTMSGESPVTAMAIGTSAGVGTLQTKSVRPLTVTFDEIAATTGSFDFIRTANARVAIFGDSKISVTIPAEMVRELKPTGTKLPSADKSSNVKVASNSDVVRIRRVCEPVVF